jgi:hypothetical protein
MRSLKQSERGGGAEYTGHTEDAATRQMLLLRSVISATAECRTF